MKTNGNTLETLANSQMYRDYERAYNEVTGLPVALRPVESWKLPLHNKRKENPWCAMMAGKSRSCAACLLMQEKLAKSAMEKPRTLTCIYGLSETAVPFKLGAETIGFLQTGQIMCQKPTEASFRRAINRTKDLGIDLDATKAREAFFNTTVVPAKKMEFISRLLASFAEHLSIRCNQIAIQTSHAEPPVITRAKQFITAHLTEELSLEAVAKSVNTSKFYFCKIFKKATGINFTDYVVRTRLERARGLLLNPNLRVSEIAYEVGFQSLTHFNRVFKRILGHSPTHYRSRLPLAA